MTRDEIDILWQQAMTQAVKDGEMFTRYHFAALVAAAEREACAAIVEAEAMTYAEPTWALRVVDRIRARSQA